MEPSLDVILGQTVVVSPVSYYDLAQALAISTVLSFIVAMLYMITHGGYSYSKSFLQTIVLAGVTVTLIMVIIGSDIARAFALVGAMSIVRFRTPVKDSRDLMFIFAAIAIGMASGTQFHVFAGIFTAFLAVLILGFHFWKIGDRSARGYVVKVRLNTTDKNRFADLCGTLCRRYSIVSVNRSNGEDVEDIIYEIDLKRGVTYSNFIDRQSETVKPLSINLLVGEGNVIV